MINAKASQAVQDFVFELLTSRNPSLATDGAEFLDTDYFAAGYLDSFGAIEAITSIEDRFNIRLDADDLENPDFKIIGGLIRIVTAKLA